MFFLFLDLDDTVEKFDDLKVHFRTLGIGTVPWDVFLAFFEGVFPLRVCALSTWAIGFVLRSVYISV